MSYKEFVILTCAIHASDPKFGIGNLNRDDCADILYDAKVMANYLVFKGYLESEEEENGRKDEETL